MKKTIEELKKELVEVDEKRGKLFAKYYFSKHGDNYDWDAGRKELDEAKKKYKELKKKIAKLEEKK